MVAGYAEPLLLWELSGELADIACCLVDLLDLRAASTVMQYQIITRGKRWWAADRQAAIYEVAILSEKTELDIARKGCWTTSGSEEVSMIDDVLLNKVATIERCMARAREEYAANPEGFAQDYTRQDAAILNMQRVCEAALDMGHHLIRRKRLGVPQSARDVFALLARGGWISSELADVLKRMVGFRNIAVHDYQTLQLPITVSIITRHLDDFLTYSATLLKKTHRS